MAAEDRGSLEISRNSSSSRVAVQEEESIHPDPQPAEVHLQYDEHNLGIKLHPAPDLQQQDLQIREGRISILGRDLTSWYSSTDNGCARNEGTDFRHIVRFGEVSFVAAKHRTPGQGTPPTSRPCSNDFEYSPPYEAAALGAVYLVVGIFSRADSIPKERMIHIKHRRRLFWSIFWAIVKLRGLGALFSLKDVKQFRIYKCDWEASSHRRVPLEAEDERTLYQLLSAYRSWSTRSYVDGEWVRWIHSSLNNSRTEPKGGPRDRSLSLEIVLGWSVFRLTVAICFPVALSLAIGLWLQSRNWTDLTTIQTAWTVASYIVTASALVAVLIGLISNASD